MFAPVSILCLGQQVGQWGALKKHVHSFLVDLQISEVDKKEVAGPKVEFLKAGFGNDMFEAGVGESKSVLDSVVTQCKGYSYYIVFRELPNSWSREVLRMCGMNDDENPLARYERPDQATDRTSAGSEDNDGGGNTGFPTNDLLESFKKMK